jgi:hypothetical protein
MKRIKWEFTTNGTGGGGGPRDSLGIFTLDGLDIW